MAMVFTSAPIRPTALLQLPYLNIGPRTSAPGSELGHLAVRAQTITARSPQRGRVSSPPTPTPTAPTADRPGPRRPSARDPLHCSGVVDHLQRLRETDAAGVG